MEGVRALTLAECFELALRRSEEIAIKQEILRENEGRFLQALSGALPRASFELSEKRQDGSGGSAFTLKDIPERKFVFSQPLFSGFKEFAAMAGARAERRQRTHERSRAEQLLFIDVSDAFYFLLEHQEDARALEAIRAALSERIDDLNAREQLGRSRPSEVASAESRLRQVEADIESARSDETVARQLLEFLTGLAPIDAVADPDPSVALLSGEAEYVGKAGQRSDVQAAHEAWRVAGKEVAIARAGFWPDVSVEGNYYTKRAGVAQDIDWDVLLKVDVPIFQGGETAGAVKQAKSRERQAKLRFEQTQREAALNIREMYAKLQGAVERTAALERALKAAEENARLQSEDYRLNLVSNLEVLEALELLQNARREVIHSRYETKRLDTQLHVAIGETL